MRSAPRTAQEGGNLGGSRETMSHFLKIIPLRVLAAHSAAETWNKICFSNAASHTSQEITCHSRGVDMKKRAAR